MRFAILLLLGFCHAVALSADTYCFSGGLPPKALKLAISEVCAARGLAATKLKKTASLTVRYGQLPKGRAAYAAGLVLYRHDNSVLVYQNHTIVWRRGYRLDATQTRLVLNAALDTLNPDVFVVTPETWLLYQRNLTSATLTPEPVGISFQFPVSPKADPDATGPWNGYFVTQQKPIPLGAKQLVLEFKIDADSSVHFNHQSDASNTGCEYSPSALRVHISKGFLYGADEDLRWWYTTGFTLTDTPDVVKFTVPLTPEGWNNVYAHPATDSYRTPYFLDTLQHANYVGITFGGGCAYSHGVNVSYGTAKFTLLKMYCTK